MIGPNLPSQVRNILYQLNSPYQDQKHKAMELARGDPDLLASIIGMKSNTLRGVSPAFNSPAESRTSYPMGQIPPYLNSGGIVPMQAAMNRPMRLPSQGMIPTQGSSFCSSVIVVLCDVLLLKRKTNCPIINMIDLIPGVMNPHHQMNFSGQIPMPMQRPQSMNRILTHPRGMYPSMPSYGVMGSRPMSMGNAPFMPRQSIQLTKSTSMPGLLL